MGMFDGFFKEGKRMNIVELKEMKGYWKEMNEENKVISICKMKRMRMMEFVISL